MTNYKRKTNEEKQQELKELTEKLENGVSTYLNSENYKSLLQALDKFHSYSLDNNLLIALQKPDATYVAGYTTWQKLNRSVEKGQKSIKILCPVKYKTRKEVGIYDENKNPVFDETGHLKTEEKEVEMISFRVGNVFDYSQTVQMEGKPVIDLFPVKDLQGNVSNFKELKDSIEAISPVPVEYIDINSGAKGYFNLTENKICIQKDMSEQQTIKTLCHEITHSILHNEKRIEELKSNGIILSKEEKEIEAESTAFVISNHFGIDVSEYSFPYVATWGKTPDLVKQHLNTIRTTSASLIEQIDSQLEKLNLQKEIEEPQTTMTEYEIATRIDNLSRVNDPYEYADTERYPGSNRDELLSDIRKQNFSYIDNFLNDISLDSPDCEMKKEAFELMNELKKYKETSDTTSINITKSIKMSY